MALVSDLMEEWRSVLVDSLVLSLVQQHSFSLADFQVAPDAGGVYLSANAQKKFFVAFEKRMRQQQCYQGVSHSYRYVMQQQAKDLSLSIEEAAWERYQPLRIR